MTVRDDLSIDWDVSPRIISVDAPSIEITMQDLYDTLRDAEDDPGNMDEEYIVSGAGKEPLGGGVLVGLTITLNNAKLSFEARGGPSYVQCNISGGNLVAIDGNGDEMGPIEPSAYTQIVLANSSSATLSEGSDPSAIATAVWETESNMIQPNTFGSVLKELIQQNDNKLIINQTTSELWLYDDDGVSVLKKWPLKNASGKKINIKGVNSPVDRGERIA